MAKGLINVIVFFIDCTMYNSFFNSLWIFYADITAKKSLHICELDFIFIKKSKNYNKFSSPPTLNKNFVNRFWSDME